MPVIKKKLIVFLVCGFLLSISICYGQEVKKSTVQFAGDNPLRKALDSAIDHSVRQYLQDKRAVGISIGVLVNNKASFYNYGETKAGNKKLPGKNTVYEIGSVTKAFTGILLAGAVLDQKIDPENDIREYLDGDYPNLEYNGASILVKDLANHTSTITRIFPNMWERPEYDSLNPLKGYDRTLLYEGLHAMKMDTFPGRVSSYSNMAVALLGTILEDVYEQSWFQLLYEEILKPLQMKETRIDLTGLPYAVIALPHNDQREPCPLWDISRLPAMGALRSTTSDLIRFIQANNDDELPAIALSHQTTYGTIREGLGFNWFIHTTPEGYQVFEHGGGTGGSRSSLECLPGLRSGFVILTNSLANRKELEKQLESIVIKFARN